MKTPLKDILTPANLVALDRLACLLSVLPDDYKGFEMSHFAQSYDESYNPAELTTPKCGTSCCAMGHLPLLGYEGRKGEHWTQYGERITGLSPSDFGKDDERRDPEQISLWNWMFSCAWADNANTPVHAAKRIAFVLDHYDTYAEPVNCPRDDLNAAQNACDAMDAIGEEALLTQRRRIPLAVIAPAFYA